MVYPDYSLPDDFRGTGFLSASCIFTLNGGVYTAEPIVDLRGNSIGVISGGTTGGTSTDEFLDGVFRIQNSTDPTKELAVNVAGIATATSRTLIIPDTDVDLADIAVNTLKVGITTQQASDITDNNAKVTNVTTNLTEGTTTVTTVDVNSSDGANATLAEASTTRAGILGKAKWDEIVVNTSHSGSAHAPSGAEVNVQSDWNSVSGDSLILNKPTTITVQQTSDISDNNGKVTNATHTGDVTGDTALTIAADAVDISHLSATGTPSSSTYLRGDNTWDTVASGGASTHGDLNDTPDTSGTNTDHDVRYVPSISATAPTLPVPFAGALWYDTTTPAPSDPWNDTVIGPSTATDNAVARFDSSTGNLIQSSTVTIDDNGNTVFPGNVTFDAVVEVSGTSAQTVDFNNGNKAKLTQTGDVTLTLIYPGISNYTLVIVGTAFALTWPASLKFPGGTAPAVVDDCLVGIYYDGTDSWATFSESMS